jgi:hypothetical protein
MIRADHLVGVSGEKSDILTGARSVTITEYRTNRAKPGVKRRRDGNSSFVVL